MAKVHQWEYITMLFPVDTKISKGSSYNSSTVRCRRVILIEDHLKIHQVRVVILIANALKVIWKPLQHSIFLVQVRRRVCPVVPNSPNINKIVQVKKTQLNARSNSWGTIMVKKQETYLLFLKDRHRSARKNCRASNCEYRTKPWWPLIRKNFSK